MQKIIQLHPTSDCNRIGSKECSFCSYRDNDDKHYLDKNRMINALIDGVCYDYNIAKFSGGGEPLLHPDIENIMSIAQLFGYTNYLQTNGDYLQNVHRDLVHDIRVSFGDGIKFSVPKIKVDGYSYVVTSQPDYNNLNNLIDYAICTKSYVKVTQDDTGSNVPSIREIISNTIESPLVTYWDVNVYHQGFITCPSAIKSPVLGYDGYFYPCCLDENEPVVIIRNNELHNIPIKHTKIGDYCFDNGYIESKFVRSGEEILEFILSLGKSIRVSKDHTMLVGSDIVFKNEYWAKRSKEIDSYQLIEKKASEIGIGDMLPVITNVEVPIAVTNIPLEMYSILGYYVAEGWFSEEKKQVGFMFGHKENAWKIFEQLMFALGITYRVYIRETGRQYSIYDASLMQYVRLCGSKSYLKCIPSMVFNSSIEAKKAFLKAYIDGDGYVQFPSKHCNGFKLSSCTVSRQLASDLILLYWQLGITAGVFNDGVEQIEGRQVNIRDRYRVRVSGYYNLKHIKDILCVDIYKGAKSQKKALGFPKTNNLMFLPVKKIGTFNSQKLYDISVSGTNSFFAGVGGVLVHNCRTQYAKEPMWGYNKSMRMAGNFPFSFDGRGCTRCYYDINTNRNPNCVENI